MGLDVNVFSDDDFFSLFEGFLLTNPPGCDLSKVRNRILLYS